MKILVFLGACRIMHPDLGASRITHPDLGACRIMHPDFRYISHYASCRAATIVVRICVDTAFFCKIGELASCVRFTVRFSSCGGSLNGVASRITAPTATGVAD